MAAMTLRERQRQVREDAILDAAQELMMEQGYADMSMDDLATRVGVSKATLYQHFPSKEELAINVIVRGMRRGEARITSLERTLPAITRLERVIRDAINERVAMNAARMMLLPATVQQHPLLQAQKARMMTALGALIDEAKADGAVDRALPTPLIARMIMVTVREASHGDFAETNEAALHELGALLARLLFNGIKG